MQRHVWDCGCHAIRNGGSVVPCMGVHRTVAPCVGMWCHASFSGTPMNIGCVHKLDPTAS